MKIWQKTVASIATFALLLNSLAAPITVLAQEETPSPTPEATVQPTDTPAPTDEATPTENPTSSPEATIEATATPEETAVPDASPTEIATPLASPESLTEAGTPTPTDAVVETQAPESNPTTQGSPITSPEPTAEAGATPTSTPTFAVESQPENATVTTTVVSTSVFPETVQNDLFKLITDKLDYSPSEVAIITGNNFTPNKTYSLTVSSTDDPATSTTVDVTTDGSGSFTYNYQLDGNYRPNYSVEVKDGEQVVATTTFTDSETVVTYTVDTYGNSSHTTLKDSFYQGETVYGKGTRSSSANLRLRYLNPSSVVALTCAYSNFTAVTCDYSLPSNTPTGTWKIQLGRCDTGCGNDNNWYWTGYAEATFTVNQHTGSVSGYKWNDLNGNTAKDSNEPKLSGWVIYVDANNNGQKDSGELSATTDSSGNYTISNIPLGSYYIREVNQTGWTETWPYHNNYANYVTLSSSSCDIADVDFGNRQPTATLKLVKMVDYGPAQPGDWTLYATGTNGFSDYGNSTTFHTVNAGASYTLSESNISGWSQYGNWSCDKGSLQGSALTLSAGQNATCTITNHRDMGSIKVNKYTDLNGDGDWSDSNETSNSNANTLGFRWSIDGVGYTFGTTANNEATNLSNYYHTVDESSPAGYHFVGWYVNGGRGSCANPDGTTLPLIPTITKDHTTEITLCNSVDTGRITFTKVVFGGTSQPSDWIFNMSGDGTAKSGDTKSIKTGAYTITESGPSGYFVSSVSGTACRLGTDNHTINLTVTTDGGTCIIANQKFASIKIIKDTNPESDEHFHFDTTGSGLSDFSLSDEHSKTFSNLYSDEYTVTEQPTSGWDLSNISCTGGEGSDITIDSNVLSIDLGTGKDIVCTFHNTQRGSIEGYKWNDLNGNGEKDEKHWVCNPWWNIFNCHQEGTDEPTLSGWIINLENIDNQILATDTTDEHGNYDFENVIPGTYKVCELPKDGWVMTYPNQGNENLCKTVTVGAGQDVDDFNFGNQLNTGTVTVTKFDDVNQNGAKDKGESTLSGWTINLGRSSQKTGDDGTTTFTNVISDTYELSENLQSGYVQTNIYCDPINEKKTYVDGGVVVNPGENVQCYIGNFEEQPGVSISKTNDKPDGISAGQTVDYSVTLTNTGNIPVTNITIQDALPGGFTYVVGSTTGATTVDPSISGSVLSWTGLGTLAAGGNITIHYQAKTSSDLVNGIYTNFATCEVSKDFSNYKAELDSVDESLQCDPAASSTVPIGNGVSYGGNLNTVGQVLGASTELPGTGSPTVLLIIALGALGVGLFLRGYNLKVMKKAKKSKAKRVIRKGKGKTKKHAKK